MNDATAFTDHLKKKALARRGKSAEDQVKVWCERKQAEIGLDFDYERNPDSKAAGTRKFVVRTGDFYMYCNQRKRCACVEVKETEKDALPKANFKGDQISRGYKRQRAGVVSVVLVHLKPSGWYWEWADHFFHVTGPWKAEDLHGPFSSASYALDAALAPLFN